jgi:hypothetical protein
MHVCSGGCPKRDRSPLGNLSSYNFNSTKSAPLLAEVAKTLADIRWLSSVFFFLEDSLLGLALVTHLSSLREDHPSLVSAA